MRLLIECRVQYHFFMNYLLIVYQCIMLAANYVLSLNNWPKQIPKQQTYALSPYTQKIITKTKIEIHTFLPITFEEFKICYQETQTENINQLYEKYLIDKERRIKKSIILKEMRNKLILAKHKSKRKSKHKLSNSNNFSNSKTKRSGSNENFTTLTSLSKRKNSKNEQSEGKLRLISSQGLMNSKQKAVKVTNLSCYKQNQKKEQNQYYSESTKSKEFNQQKTIDNNSEYGYLVLRQPKIRKKKEKDIKNGSMNRSESSKERQLCQKLLVEMGKWEKMDCKHVSEISELKDLNMKERERLRKMQEIEKGEIKTKIRRIKSKLMTQC